MGVVDIYQELTNGKMIENDELLSIVEYDKINGLLISKVAVARRKVGEKKYGFHENHGRKI